MKLEEIIEKEIERTCENCNEYLVCFSENDEEPTKVCKNWTPDFMEFQNAIEKLKKEGKISDIDLLNNM